MKVRVWVIRLSPLIVDGANKIRFWYCFATPLTDTLSQSTSISELGMSSIVVVSVLTPALAIIDSMLLSIVVFAEDSDELFCLTTIAVKNKRIAAPATKTKIQLNCISIPFLF